MRCPELCLSLLGCSALAIVWYNARGGRKKRRRNLKPKSSTLSDTPEGHFVELSEGRTFYRLYNEHCSLQLTPILLCHGFMGSSEYLIPLVKSLLPSNRRIYLLDLYGRGNSDHVDTDHTCDLFADQIIDLMDKLNVSNPVDLIGYSMGGGIVVRVAAKKTEIVQSITLIAPVGLPSMTNISFSALKILLKVLQNVSHLFCGGHLHEWLVTKLLQPSESVLRDGWSNVDTPRYQWFKKQMIRRFTDEKNTLPLAVASTLINFPFDNLTRFYAEIGQDSENMPPVLALWGECDRTVPCDREGLVELIPNAKVITWPNEGHMLAVELAEEVAVKLLEFWDKH